MCTSLWRDYNLGWKHKRRHIRNFFLPFVFSSKLNGTNHHSSVLSKAIEHLPPDKDCQPFCLCLQSCCTVIITALPDSCCSEEDVNSGSPRLCCPSYHPPSPASFLQSFHRSYFFQDIFLLFWQKKKWYFFKKFLPALPSFLGLFLSHGNEVYTVSSCLSLSGFKTPVRFQNFSAVY